jgi:hypothetical protein
VDASTLRAIANALPDGMPLSVALGDLHDPLGVGRLLASVDGIARRPGELYVKVGLAGVREPGLARRALGALLEAVGAARLRPEVVVVGYADHERAGTLPREAVATVAADVGARGVLLDTWSKDGRDLFAWASGLEIRRWLELSTQLGLLTAVAGSLSSESIRRAARLWPDIVGVRGAACDGGRAGTVTAGRVRHLATTMAEATRNPETVA